MATLTFSSTEVESLRRSAAMAPLPSLQVVEVLEDLRQLHHERDAMRRLLVELRPAWRGSATVLDRLASIVDPVTDVASATRRGPDPLVQGRGLFARPG